MPDDGNIMLGRGLIARPFLTEELYRGTKQNIQEKETRMKLQAFHDEVYEGYKQVMSGDMNVLFKMKELWAYMIGMKKKEKKEHKLICKTKKCMEYEQIVRGLLFTKS
mgnify:CR=1 FL=1